MFTEEGDKIEQAKLLIGQAIALVGEGGIAELLRTKANANIQDALIALRSTEWWTKTIQHAIHAPRTTEVTLLMKLIDKAVATPVARKGDEDDGFQLKIVHEYKKE